MPVLALFTGPITQAQYDTVRLDVDWEHKQPAGGLFHSAAFDDAGHLHAADVWETPDALNAFAHDALMPACARHGITPPSVAVYPAHTVHAFAGLDKYRV